jgi:[FeFe] hydrogenase (group B1/B3)
MQLDNNTSRVRRAILVRLARLCFENRLVEGIDRIPIEMRPKNSGHDRCCIYKERAIIKYRLMAMLGLDVEDETDELTQLSDYARMALEDSAPRPSGLTLISDACSACVRTHYFVTNACRGCYARPCMVNCPKKCIAFSGGQAEIDSEKCVNCGRCMNVCPYHAIVYVPIPCEEECPVGAISKDETGREVIDREKCIACGKCIVACPFGAIMDKSQMVTVIRHLQSDRKTVALLAPSIIGQFNASFEQIVGALKALGFDSVLEVARGADVTVENETKEWTERMRDGAPYMTTSCCPAYVEMVKRHAPELLPFVSHTPSPMRYAAQLAAEQVPGAVRVFVGPCTAKKLEAQNDDLIDSVLTFEELGALFVAKGIEVEDVEPEPSDALAATAGGRGFAVSGGVAGAIREAADRMEGTVPELRSECLNGLSRKSVRLLKSYAKGNPGFNFLEVMGCNGGCVGGPCVVGDPRTTTRKVEAFVQDSRRR